MPRAERVALGLRAHSGWAALVALAGPVTAPEVIDRRRLELCDGSFPRQPYHAAEDLPAARAEALVGRSLATAAKLAREALAAVVKVHRTAGRELNGAGLVLASGRPLPGELGTILGSHALIHTAEGEMYRRVLREAFAHAGIRVVGFVEREIAACAAERLELAADTLQSRIGALGKPLGPPWTADQKLASLAAWLVLRGASG